MTRVVAPLLSMMAFAWLLAGCGDEAEEASVEPARAVTVVEVELRPMRGATTANGLLVPREEAAVVAEVTGYQVTRVLAEAGDVVRAGDPLAVLDDTLLDARVAEARAALSQARSEAARVAGLEGTGVLAEEDIDQRQSQARIAQARVDDLLAQQARMTVRAPVSGVVLERNVQPGAVSGPGEPMFRIARDGLIELDAEVPEDALGGIAPGTPARVELPTGEAFNGEVRLVSPVIDPQTKLGVVSVQLPRDPALRAGGFARVEFQAQAEPVPAVPEKAIQFEAGGPVLTVIGDGNRAHRVRVATGERAEGWVEIVDGPPVGTRVALGGGAFLLDGDLVDPQPPSSGAEAAGASAGTPDPGEAG